MEQPPVSMAEDGRESCSEKTMLATADLSANIKKEVELIIDECEDEEYYDTESESNYNFDYEPEVKHLAETDLNIKTKSKIRCRNYIYGKYVIRQCPICGFEFSSAHCWTKHITFKHHLKKPEDLEYKYNEAGAKCKSCDYHTPTPRYNRLLEHQFTHMPFNNYLKCKLCDWRTTTHSSMNLHLRQQHSEKLEVTTKRFDVTICPYCKQEFASQWYLRKHMIYEHERNTEDRTCFVCLDCGEEFLTNVSLREHVFVKYADKSADELGFREMPGNGDDDAKIICTQCPTVFRKIRSNGTLINIREHYMLHLGESTGKHAYKCRYCDESFRRFDNIRLHICEELHTVLESSVGKKPVSKTAFKARVLKRKLKKVKKNERRELFDLKSEYMKNIRYVCLRCGISFGKSLYCKRHMFQTHGMNKPKGLDFKKLCNQGESDIYECKICEQFTCDFDLNTMLVHARIHTVFDPFQCKFCQTSFAYESDIPRHECIDAETVKSLTETKYPKEAPMPYMESFCPKCMQTYTRPSSLTRHMKKAHGMNEPYGLGFEIFESKEANKKVYRCTECKNFTLIEKNLKDMLEHGRLHFPFDSFRCTICKERFRLKEHARNHQCTTVALKVDEKFEEEVLTRTRLNKMGRFCPKCGKSFKKAYVCKNHSNKLHGMDKPDGLGFERVISNDDDTIDKSETYRCIDCLSYTIPKLDLSLMLEHAREHFPFDSFWCMLCNESFRLKIQATKHKCLKASNTGDDDNDEEIDNISRIRYPKTFDKRIRKFCPECNIEMSTLKTWRWHLNRYHAMDTLPGLHMEQTEGNLVECLICRVQTTYARRQEHRFIHLPFKPYQCRFCLEYFMEIEKAKSHCNECAEAPLELPEIENVKEDVTTTKKRRTPRRVETEVAVKKVKISDETESESNESNSENDDAPSKGIRVVLADDSDFAKFVRISCPLCPDTEFESNQVLSHHFYEVHNSFREHYTIHQTNAANCKTCNKYFNVVYKKTMVKHYLTDISATCFSCRLCDRKILYYETMRSHLLDDHQAVIAGQTQDQSSSSTNTTDPLKVTSVDISKVSLTTMAIPTSKTAVFNEFNEYISYACPECNIPFDSSEQWHLHINGEHDFFEHHQLNIEATTDGFKRCKQCNVNINGGILAEQRHKLTHMQYKSFICTLCLHRSTTLGVLTQHFRRRHFAKGRFECCLCPSVLTTSCELIEHMKNVHDPSEYPPRLCTVCFSLLSSTSSLVTHMELHNPNRELFQCDFCNRNYKYKRELNLHVQAKHPEQEVKSG